MRDRTDKQVCTEVPKVERSHFLSTSVHLNFDVLCPTCGNK